MTPPDGQPGHDEEYCTNCGAVVKTEAVMCPECGVDREGVPSPSSESGDGGMAAKIPGMKPGATTRNVVVALVAAFVALAVIGAAAGPTDPGMGTQNVPSDTGADTGNGGDTSGNGGDTGASESSGPAYAVRVDYDGEWGGAISVTGGGDSTTESIGGTGTTTIEITGEPSIISANAQKRDGGAGEITVQIIQDGDVVSEASASTEYGMAQTSKSFY